MRKMGLMPIYQRPKTSTPAPGAQDLPLSAAWPDDRPPQPSLVYRSDVHPLGPRFLYLVAIMDWWSRRVLAWRLSNTWRPSSASTRSREALDPLR